LLIKITKKSLFCFSQCGATRKDSENLEVGECEKGTQYTRFKKRYKFQRAADKKWKKTSRRKS
jgi:hypothetical protein